MGVKIHKVELRREALLLRAELDKKADYKLLNAIFRDMISARLSIESSFGLDESYEEQNLLNYPVNLVFDLIYDARNGRVGITWKGPKETNKSES